MYHNIRTKPYNLYQVSGDRENTAKELIGEALPFSGQSYGFTLLFKNGLKLVMYPAKDYSKFRKKFDVMQHEQQGDITHRTKIGEGWRSKYGAGFNVTVDFAGIKMRLQLLPKP